MSEQTSPARARRERSDQDYAIDSLLKGLKVLEALEGTNFEPVSIQRVQDRTRLSYDTCLRSLRTLRLAGFVREEGRGWTLTARYIAFAQRAAEAQNGR